MSDRWRGPVPRETTIWRRVWRPFWTLPAVIMAVSVVLGLMLPEAERRWFGEWTLTFGGDSGGARSVLSTIAAAMISITGLVFSVTMVVLQLASTQFSPRVVGNFLDARVSQITLGVFTGSFLYSLTVLRSVRGEEQDGGLVPEVSVSVSYLYVLASVAMFLAFIAHITSQVQVSRLISDLGHGTVSTIERQLGDAEEQPADGPTDHPCGSPPARADPGSGGAKPQDCELRLDARHGYVVAIDIATLVGTAARHDVVVVLGTMIGDFLVPHQVIGEVRRPGGREPDLESEELRDLARCLHLRSERELGEDPLFGTRQLVDIAERALSPGINDPTTAAQAVNEMHLILRALAIRPDPPAQLRDDDGAVRVTYPPQTFALHLELVVDELMLYGRDEAQVPEAIGAMLRELRDHARPEHVASIDAARLRVVGR